MKKIYIITGTSRGLGEAFVEELKGQDAQVFCLSRKKYDRNDGFSHVCCDLSKIETLSGVMDRIFSTINLSQISSITLINNAGVLDPIFPIQRASVEAISNNIDVNLKALIIFTSLFIQKTKNIDVKKLVVNISSGAGKNPYAGWSVYCATKAGVDLFTRCVALEQEVERFPITIFSFYPSIMDTNMQDIIRKSEKKDFPRVEDFIGYKNDGNLLSPGLVAQTLLNFIKNNDIESGKVYDVDNMIG
ncbi:short-chain dehydrogenase [Candidatus Peregrinibacteria bacterium]|nr:MAG: short-chain dehydrogenase [Candidatus Peregrinibacteria bacterium]